MTVTPARKIAAEVQTLQAALRQQATRGELTRPFNRRHLSEPLPAMGRWPGATCNCWRGRRWIWTPTRPSITATATAPA